MVPAGGNGMRVASIVSLTEQEKSQLIVWSRGRTVAQRLVIRAKIVLLAAYGVTNKE